MADVADVPIILRYEIVPIEKAHKTYLQVELSDGDVQDVGEAYSNEDDEVTALKYVAATCKGRTLDEVKKSLDARRVELIRASAVIK